MFEKNQIIFLEMKNINVDKTVPKFTDMNETSVYAVDAVSALYNLGVINGMSDSEFAPLKNATRAEAAKIVYGILDFIR